MEYRCPICRKGHDRVFWVPKSGDARSNYNLVMLVRYYGNPVEVELRLNYQSLKKPDGTTREMLTSADLVIPHDLQNQCLGPSRSLNNVQHSASVLSPAEGWSGVIDMESMSYW